MTFYSEMAAVADEMLLEFGYDATIRAADTASDPVTGAGAADGATRTVRALQTGIDYKVFPESLVQTGDRMFLFGAVVHVGEKLIDGTEEWAVKRVQHIQPDNSTHIMTKALVRG
ncbi:hypothetical protein [uncultured Ruegeria sp.]|uniref:hypothetical protein n=1 Tax=uncultured Ruegeria sp. TaxID=259304 RepID=UPI002612C335|nr:hypothetical protein [uncultured Ruegeria sp.]